MPEEVIIADLTKVCGVPSSRVSEIAAGLGVAPGNKGRRLMKLSLADGIRIAIVRELQAAGLSVAAALDIVRQIRDADLADIIANERRVWLIVRKDENGPAEYVFRIANLKETVAIIEEEHESTAELTARIGRGQALRNVRLVDLYQVVRAVTVARLERLKAAAKQASGLRVSSYTAEPGTSGIQLHGSLRLGIFKDGKGLAVPLDPDMARELAAELVRVADAAEAPPAAEGIN